MLASEAKKKDLKAPPSQRTSGVASTNPLTVEPVVFYPRWCKQCGLCVAFCAQGAIEIGEDGNPVLTKPECCNSCGLCEVLCPDFAIAVPARHAKT